MKQAGPMSQHRMQIINTIKSFQSLSTEQIVSEIWYELSFKMRFILYLDHERQSRFKVLRSCLVFNLERRFDKVNSIVDCTLFLPSSLFYHISLDLKSSTFREPRKTRDALNVVSTYFKIGFSIFQLKIK